MSEVKIPTNGVVAGGTQFLKRKNKIAKTVANIRPGRLAMRDTDDDHFKVATDGLIHGVLGWVEDNYTNPAWTKTDNPVAEDEFSLVCGPGLEVKARLKSGENVVEGDLLVAAADGELKKAATLSVTVPSGGTAVTSSAAQPDLTEAGSAPPGGRIVAVARMDMDATSEAKDIVVESLI